MTILLSNTQLFFTILVIAFGTMLTRFLPVLIWRGDKVVSPFIAQLQTLLPSAAIGLLVIYCFKDLQIGTGNQALPEFGAVLMVILLHRAFKNTLLSIGGGTVFYMFLLQRIF